MSDIQKEKIIQAVKDWVWPALFGLLTIFLNGIRTDISEMKGAQIAILLRLEAVEQRISVLEKTSDFHAKKFENYDEDIREFYKEYSLVKK